MKKTFIVAEAGNNHEGSFQRALKMIDLAKDAGVDAIKFQTFNVNLFLDKKHPKFKMYKSFELSKSAFEKLSSYAKKKKIIFFSTPLDLESAFFLNKIQNIFKISSGDINFELLIKLVASFKKRMIISTGASNISEINNAVKIIKGQWNKQMSLKNLGIMHCISEYPANIEKINLNTIHFLKKRFPSCEIGFSDHTVGDNASIYARCAGVKIIEKHFTINNNFSDFRDHKLSLNPKDLKKFVSQIRYLDIIFGNENKKIYLSEKKNLKFLRRKIYLNKNKLYNSKIQKKDILHIRSNSGLHLEFEKKFIGKKIKKKIFKKGFLNKEHLEKI